MFVGIGAAGCNQVRAVDGCRRTRITVGEIVQTKHGDLTARQVNTFRQPAPPQRHQLLIRYPVPPASAIISGVA